MMNKKVVAVAGTAVGVVGVGVIVYKLAKLNKLKNQQEDTCDEDTTTEDGCRIIEVTPLDIITSWTNAGGTLCSEEDLNEFYEWLISLNFTEVSANKLKTIAGKGINGIKNNAREFLEK